MAEGTEAQEPEGPAEPGSASLSSTAAMAIGVAKGRAGPRSDPEFDAFLRKQSRLIDLQTEHLHEQRELILSRLRWGRFSDRVKALLQVVTCLAGLAIVLVIAVMAWRAHEDRGFVIEAFATPPVLAQRGLTGEILAGELMDHISEIERIAAGNSISRSDQVKADHREDFKVEIPETGLSLSEVWRVLRNVLGSERKIEGDLREEPSGGLLLTVRVAGAPAIVVRGGPGDIDALEQQAAEQVFAATNSGNYVIYLDVSGRRVEAITKAKELAAQDPNFIPLWSTLEHAVDPLQALTLAKIAERTQPGSPYAWFEALRAELDLGHAEAALSAALKLRDTLRRSPPPSLSGSGGDYLRWLAKATISRLTGDYARAIPAASMMRRLLPGNQFVSVEDDAWLHDDGAARDRLAEVLATAVSDPWGEARARYAIAAASGDWPAAAATARNVIAADDAARLKDPIPEGMAGLAQVQAARDTPLLAEAELRLGQTQDAAALIASTPGDAYDALRERGRIAQALGDPVTADHWFAEAARQAPSLPFAYRDWAEAILSRGKPNAALAKLVLARARGPRYADVAELEGEALMAKRDFNGAVRAFASADTLAPNWGRNHLLWGEALKLAGHGGEARAQFETANRLTVTGADWAALKGLLARPAWAAPAGDRQKPI